MEQLLHKQHSMEAPAKLVFSDNNSNMTAAKHDYLKQQ